MSGQLIRSGETVRLIFASAVAAEIYAKARIRRANGRIQDLEIPQKTTGSARAVEAYSSDTIATEDSEVVDAIVFVRGVAVKPGQLYAALYVASSEELKTALCKGYVHDGHDVSLGEFQVPGSGPGWVRTIASANPAANTEVVLDPVPTNARWRPESLMVQIVQGITDTPRPALEILDATPIRIALVPVAADVAVSTTIDLCWARGAQSITNNVTGGSMVAPMPDVYLDEGSAIGTSTQGLGANSDYGIAQLTVEEWVIL